MIQWKHLLSHSQLSFTSCISIPVILQPVIDTIEFVRSSMSVLTTSEGSKPAQSCSCSCPDFCWKFLLCDCFPNAALLCAVTCILKGGMKMGQSRGQWQVAMHSWQLDRVEWNKDNKNDGILFSHVLTATYWRHSPPSQRHRRVNCLSAKKRDIKV